MTQEVVAKAEFSALDLTYTSNTVYSYQHNLDTDIQDLELVTWFQAIGNDSYDTGSIVPYWP